MTRPPVGSTGTLDDLQVEPGDVVESLSGTEMWPSITQTITPEGWVFDSEGDSWGPGDADLCGYPETAYFRLISRANPDQPAHIDTSNPKSTPWQEMTALEKGALLLAAHEGQEIQGTSENAKWGWLSVPAPGRYPDCAYRAVPAPTETRVQCYRGEYGKAKEHGTCIKNPDRSIDWASWEDAE